MIVAWNSLMISGLARAAAVWQQAVYLDLSIAAADFILQHQWVAGRMHRLNYGGQVAVLAQSEDFSLLIKALLDLHQATLTFPHSMDAMPWLERAIAIQAEFDQWLWSEETGGYYTTAQDASADLVVRERNYQDSAIPSANGIAISNLMRLALLTDDSVYLSRAEQALQSFGAVITGSPLACPSLLTALDWYQHGTLVRTTPEGLAPILQQYRPVVVGQVAYDLSPDVVGLVCQGLSCQSPAHTKEQLDEQIEMSQQHLAA
jgi:hypothetical protein